MTGSHGISSRHRVGSRWARRVAERWRAAPEGDGELHGRSPRKGAREGGEVPGRLDFEVTTEDVHVARPGVPGTGNALLQPRPGTPGRAKEQRPRGSIARQRQPRRNAAA